MLPLQAGAVVMATGIMSTALELGGRHTASVVLLALTALGWACLVRVRGDAASPASLTIVAATCVLGTRLAMAGWRAAGVAALVVAVALIAALLPGVVRSLGPSVRGSAFLVVVAPVAVAVLVAKLDWPRALAVVPLVAGAGLYGFVLRRFDLAELVRGRGDQWVAGGALAIGALAAAQAGLGTPSLVLWAVAMLWLPALVWGELRRPWRAYDLERWATVFPLGMYAAMSFAVGRVEGRSWILSFARGWMWIAVAGFVLTATAAVVTQVRARVRDDVGPRPVAVRPGAARAARRRAS